MTIQLEKQNKLENIRFIPCSLSLSLVFFSSFVVSCPSTTKIIGFESFSFSIKSISSSLLLLLVKHFYRFFVSCLIWIIHRHRLIHRSSLSFVVLVRLKSMIYHNQSDTLFLIDSIEISRTGELIVTSIVSDFSLFDQRKTN